MNKSMITARREGHIICRNSSFFKRAHFNDDDKVEDEVIMEDSTDQHQQQPLKLSVKERNIIKRQQQASKDHQRHQQQQATGVTRTQYGRISTARKKKGERNVVFGNSNNYSNYSTKKILLNLLIELSKSTHIFHSLYISIFLEI